MCKKLPYYLLLCLCYCASFGSPNRAQAQVVQFPQEKQAGVAQLSHDKQTYQLSNALFTASFVKEGEHLKFGGCPQMNLEPGSELFELTLGNGERTVKASDMTLEAVREVQLRGDATAAKGSERLNGKALEADFSDGALRVTWRAVLRDGSHYLRSEIEVRATQDTKMFALRPMIYSLNTSAAGSIPKVVGNTRGAVLLSDKLFAGLETPMGINSVGAAEGENSAHFTYDAWTPDAFQWRPAKALPQGVKDLGFAANEVVGAKGYLSFFEAGEQTLTFTYKSGTHKLNVVGVDVCNLEGEVVAKDYHVGSAGGAHVKNVYHLDIPKTGVYVLRYFIETKTETITSSGKISFSKKVATPVIVYDVDKETVPTASGHRRSVRQTKATAIGANDVVESQWTATSWKQMKDVPLRINEVGFYAPRVYVMEQPVRINALGEMKVEFSYQSGATRLNLCGVDLVDESGNEVVSDYHIGYTGTSNEKNIYRFLLPNKGDYRLRYFAENKTEPITSAGKIEVKLEVRDTLHIQAKMISPLQGVWSRNATLKANDNWKVSSVVGLVAPGQARRSFLAYSERERAVPWRAMPAYISWYELNINRNNDPNYTGNMNDKQCMDILKEWKKQLFDRYHVGVNSFVWDDGWDQYGTWTFNKNFPNGFADMSKAAETMGSGIGAWLGPVGGYGQSGNYRRNYWKGKGGMQLSNPAYYKVFTDAITNLCNGQGYDFRFFKFDGISGQFSAVGPDDGTVGEENAEAIIRAERMVREDIQPDIFFNTTVGTWASPFWFRYTDAVWRQEKDYGEIGNQGTDRERWITYRDNLVHQNFVERSPICPINTLMTHGFILTKFGDVSKDMDYDGIVRELRCAFACGSGMVELYNDYKLMNSIKGGKLWGDLAECLIWQQNNADVLPDAHWVGGDPWDGHKANVYGWAAWNAEKQTLALRNPAASQQTLDITLREAFEIPAYVTGTITLRKAFGQQEALEGLAETVAIDIDAPLHLVLPASSVFVFDGRTGDFPVVEVKELVLDKKLTLHIDEEKAVVVQIAPANATIKTLTWTSDNEEVAVVNDGVVVGVGEGHCTITATAHNGVSRQVKVEVKDSPFAEEGWPRFSKGEELYYYNFQFKRGGAFIQDEGVGQQVKTAELSWGDEQLFALVGRKGGFVLRSKLGHYVGQGADGKLVIVAEKSEALTLALVQNAADSKCFEMVLPNNKTQAVNQWGGGGAGKALGFYNLGDSGNVLGIFELSPVKFCSESAPVYYKIYFEKSRNFLQSNGEGEFLNTAAMEDVPEQLFALVGTAEGFLLMTPQGQYVGMRNGTAVNGQQGTLLCLVNDKAEAQTWALIVSPSVPGCFEITKKGDKSKGFNQWGGPQEGNNLGLWNVGDQNNALKFMLPQVPDFIAEVGKESDSVVCYDLQGRRVEHPQRGLYIIGGKKVYVGE